MVRNCSGIDIRILYGFICTFIVFTGFLKWFLPSHASTALLSVPSTRSTQPRPPHHRSSTPLKTSCHTLDRPPVFAVVRAACSRASTSSSRVPCSPPRPLHPPEPPQWSTACPAERAWWSRPARPLTPPRAATPSLEPVIRINTPSQWRHTPTTETPPVLTR